MRTAIHSYGMTHFQGFHPSEMIELELPAGVTEREENRQQGAAENKRAITAVTKTVTQLGPFIRIDLSMR